MNHSFVFHHILLITRLKVLQHWQCFILHVSVWMLCGFWFRGFGKTLLLQYETLHYCYTITNLCIHFQLQKMNPSQRYLTCPYNRLHVMKFNRFHHHLINCRKVIYYGLQMYFDFPNQRFFNLYCRFITIWTSRYALSTLFTITLQKWKIHI